MPENLFSKSNNVAVIGGQWGDEGKGKIVDKLAENADWVVRYAGGANAGHTVSVNGRDYVFHLLPSGALHPDLNAVLSHEVVMDLVSAKDEFKIFEENDIPRARIYLSPDINLTTNLCKLLDVRSNKIYNIGTTARGIGPTYGLRVMRAGIRLGDVLGSSVETLEKKLSDQASLVGTSEKEIIGGLEDFGIKRMKSAFSDEQKAFACRLLSVGSFLSEAEVLKKTLDSIMELDDVEIAETRLLLQEAANADQKVLYEGAQGVLLDISHGIIPYVTSSNVATAESNTGYYPDDILKVGVFKAYSTRVGNGPFPTELDDVLGDSLRETGNEYGATTGRPRRTGWFDLVAGRYAVEVSGIDAVVITKLDVLDSLDEIKVAVGSASVSREDILDRHPEYISFNGWKQKTSNLRDYDDLPFEAMKYLDFLEQNLGVPIIAVTNGKDREAYLSRTKQLL